MQFDMENINKYNDAFCQAFEINLDQLIGLKYQQIDTWDSVGHMGLIATIEDSFDIMLEMDDIVDFSSYEKGKEILRKYDVVL